MSFESRVAERRDENGLVEVFDLEDKQWRKAYPVDAREMILKNTAAWDDPSGTEPPKDTSGQRTTEQVDFNQFKDDQLRVFIGKAKLDLPASATRAQMIEALDEVGYRPEVRELESKSGKGTKNK